jgi:hypothetical protein
VQLDEIIRTEVTCTRCSLPAIERDPLAPLVAAAPFAVEPLDPVDPVAGDLPLVAPVVLAGPARTPVISTR